MKIAVQGCAHGDLDKIFSLVANQQDDIDLLIILGDIQTIRNKTDLNSISMPNKYKQMGDFKDYYLGSKKAPLTLIIGGNHESQYLMELLYGGWVCENVYYMGYASVIVFNGIRIGGLSGIYGSWYDYSHFEVSPLNETELKSVYHMRRCDVDRMSMLKEGVDILISHDWPRTIENHGNFDELFRIKPFLLPESENGTLGNFGTMELLKTLKPKYFLAAHMHIYYEAMYYHDEKNYTKFIAFDKIIPGRKYFDIIEIPTKKKKAVDKNFYYDPEWLSILKATDGNYTFEKCKLSLPKVEINESDLSYFKGLDLKIPSNFVQTAPVEGEDGYYENPQTKKFCSMVGIKFPNLKRKVNRNEIHLNFSDVE